MDRLQLLSQSGEKVRFLLMGSRLGNSRILEPAGVTHAPIGNPEADAESLRVLELTKAQIESHKGVLLQKGNERPILISIPAVEFKAPKKPEVKAKERVVAGSAEAVLLADAADTIQKITSGDLKIDFAAGKDKKSVTLSGANFRTVTASAGSKDFVCEYPEGAKIPVTLEVVTGKVETVAKP